MKIETNNIRILIIIPCYNEEENISHLLNELNTHSAFNLNIVSLPINDCSKDNTLSAITKCTKHYLNLPVNLGIGGAVQTGLIYAKRNDFDIAVQMDGDGQHPPSELHKILKPLINNEVDVCIGSRFITKEGFQSSSARRFGINFLSRLIQICSGIKISDCTSGYRAFNRKAIDLCVKYYPDKYPEPESILFLLKNGLTVKEVPVIMRSREGGVSSISGFSNIYYMMKVSLAILLINLKSFKK